MPYWSRLICLSLINVIAGFLLAAACSSTYGQGTRQGNVANNPSGPFTDSLERRSREAALRSLKVEGRACNTGEGVEPALLDQLNEDFKQLQIIRLRMVADIRAGRPFEYEQLSREAAEIRKRAGRLRDFLTVSDPQEKHQPQADVIAFDKTTIQEAGSRLCLEISRFIGNPIFTSEGVYKASDAAEAAQTLDVIVTLSTNIRNSADKLRKSN